MHSKVFILGSGPAGLTAAIYTARGSLEPRLVHGPTPYGQLSTTTDVENFPGFPEGIMGPELMEVMEKQAKRFGTEVLQDTISKVELTSRPFSLTGSKGVYTTDALIIATGATAKLLNVPGEWDLMGYGVSTCATCDGAFFRDKIITIVGGGDSACEEALFLTRFGRKVVLIHRRDTLRASKIMQERVMNHPKIEIKWNNFVVQVNGSKKDGVQNLELEDTNSGARSTLECDALFVAIGHTPNSSLFDGMLETDANGYLVPLVTSEQHATTRTKIPGVFICGDVQDHVFRQAITAAGSGCMAAIEAERFLEGFGQ